MVGWGIAGPKNTLLAMHCGRYLCTLRIHKILTKMLHSVGAIYMYKGGKPISQLANVD